MQRKLLVVEDEAPIRDGLSVAFRQHGYDVETAEDGPGGLKKALTGEFDLIILDIMLPGMDGYDVCDKVKSENGSQPIIMLTAKSAEDDIITGLSLGADDYVVKPFSLKELLLRVEAVLRRSAEPIKESSVLTIGCVRVDVQNLTGEVFEENPARRSKKKNFPFTRKEAEVLEYLHANRHRPVSRVELLEEVWGYQSAMRLETRTVDIHIAKLRKKIEDSPALPQYLITVRGKGYRLRV